MEFLKGTIEGIIFRNEENGYTVAALECNNEVVNITGVFPRINEGETVEVGGEWRTGKYGRQFNVKTVAIRAPDTVEAITRYLASGVIKGVGPVTASLITKRFGKDALDIIEFHPTRLAEIKGISKKKSIEIGAVFQSTKAVQRTVMFLSQHDITLNMALRIYNAYREDTEHVLKTNPYRMVEDVDGVGFLTADRLAQKLGVPKDSEFRLRCGLLYTLKESAENGNTYLPVAALLEQSSEKLAAEQSRLEGLLEALCVEGKLRRVRDGKIEGIMLPSHYHSEKTIADRIVMLKYQADSLSIDVSRELAMFERVNDIKLHSLQREAVERAASEGVVIITGGPGTGKTTIVKCILSILRARGESVLLCAPTGRAAKRLSDSTDEEAKTVHRALEFDPFGGGGRFNYNEYNPLNANAVVIDEISMVDAYLMSSLLKALKGGTRLIMVGDADQLPSVGAGNVLGDLIASGHITTVRLDRIYRQGEDSMIIENAHRINHGEAPIIRNDSDFFFAPASGADTIYNDVVNLATYRIPNYLGVKPRAIQVLAAMKSGLAGVDNINVGLQKSLNPPSKDKREISVGKTTFREGDRVMHIANRYELEWKQYGAHGVVRSGKGVFNGDIGEITSIDPQNGEITVRFEDDREAVYNREACLDLMLSYAITIHKSQGSEFEVVIIPVVGGNPALLTRNLLYTAVTRARRMLIICGEKHNMNRMITNNKTVERYTMLRTLLQKSIDKQALWQQALDAPED